MLNEKIAASELLATSEVIDSSLQVPVPIALAGPARASAPDDERRSLRALGPNLPRIIRYATTSGVALGISEITLLAIYATGAVGASAAALIATIVGTVPSYLMSRFWIWKDAARARVGRQIILYWATSFVAMGATSLGTGLVAALSPKGHFHHLVFVGVGFIAVNFVLWIAKYLVYQRLIFKAPAPELAS